jgi:4-aminobutyrate aminotransferase / (S)-3-amino-2-methylpropionate transaminase / 5-aminovalerate transaminase
MSTNISSQSTSDPTPGEDNNAQWMQRRQAAIPRGVSTLLPIFVKRAENSEIWDVEGRRYIDFASGIAVLNTGHLHPRVKAAAMAQLEHFSHTCFQITPYPTYVELAERLNQLVPGESAKKSLFLSTGAEAVENAVKIARAHTRRNGVIAFSGGFHGRTLMAMALTGKVQPYKAGFGTLPGEVYHLPFPIAYHGISAAQSLQALDTLLHADIDPAQIAAIIVEPIQGEGGFYVAPAEFLRSLRRLCDQHGIVLVIDEVQTGFARSGRMFAIEHAGIEPDLMTLAKSMGGGFPISAVVGKAAIMDAPSAGGLGGTYAGSPIACAAALAVLEVIGDEHLCERAEQIGQRLRGQLERLRNESALAPVIGDIRGLGAMLAMELVENGRVEQPNAALTRALIPACAKRGLILLPCGIRGNVIRFLMPLTISDALLDEGTAILADAMRDLVGHPAN